MPKAALIGCTAAGRSGNGAAVGAVLANSPLDARLEAAFKETHEHTPDARVAEIPRAGHLSNLENPEAFTAALAGFN